MREIYVLRSKHFMADSSPSDESFEGILRQNHVLNGISADLIRSKRIEHLFGDNVGKTEANTRNRLIQEDDLHERMLQLIKNGNNFEHKDHMRYIGLLRNIRQEEGLDVKFYQTEPVDIDTSNFIEGTVDQLKPVMYRPWEIPLGMFFKAWKEYLTTGVINSAVDIWVYLRDKAAVPIISENAGPINLIKVGSKHKLEGLYHKNSGFRVIGVTLDDNLGYSLDHANLGTPFPEDVEEIIQANIAGVRRMTVPELSEVRVFKYTA